MVLERLQGEEQGQSSWRLLQQERDRPRILAFCRAEALGAWALECLMSESVKIINFHEVCCDGIIPLILASMMVSPSY